MPGLSLKAEIEAFLEMETEVSKAKQVNERPKEPWWKSTEHSTSFGLVKDKK